MFKRIFKENMFCGLDIGSQRVKAALIKATGPDHKELLGLYETKTRGFQDTTVSDLGELSDCVQATLAGLAKKSGVRIKEICLGIGGDLVNVRRNGTAIPLIDRGNKVITHRDIKKVNTQARLLGIHMDEEILHDFPQRYRIDEANTAINPLGLYARKLDVETLLIVSNATKIRNVIKSVQQAGYEVLNLHFSSCVASKVALNKTATEEGCILIDIGSKVTSVLIFKDGNLRYLNKIPWGGSQVTSRIAKDLKLSFDLAEEIKKSYASAFLIDQKNDEEILVKQESTYLPIKREVICHAIDPLIVELVDSIKRTIDSSNFAHQLRLGVSIVGGGSLLPGLIERIEEAMNLPVSMAKVRVGSKTIRHVATYAASIGLAQAALENARGNIFSPNGHDKWPQNIVNQVKEFYQEYF